MRVFQQLATAAAIAPGRIEAVAGRGSSAITFPLFDHDERDYDLLYASKLELLLAVNAQEHVTWNGPHRQPPAAGRADRPPPREPLKIWLGTGGSPESVGRAVELGVPMFLGILGGTPEHWAQYGHAYRDAWAQVGHPAEPPTSPSPCTVLSARTTHSQGRPTSSTSCGCSPPAPPRSAGRRMAPPGRSRHSNPAGWSSPAAPTRSPTASCTCTSLLGHTRQILQMDVGGMPQATYLRAIELLGTEVLPQVRKELS